MNLAEREAKLEIEEQRGSVTDKILLNRMEMFDQIGSVIHFICDKFSFMFFVCLCFTGPD